jgi:hypothetical protein
MPVTRADFGLHGRIDNYRARLTDLLVELDRMVRQEIDDVNRSRLGGKGEIRYETLPPRWTLAWRADKHRYEANLMAFAQGGAWVIHGRMGLDRPFRGAPATAERDRAAIRQEVADQVATDLSFG